MIEERKLLCRILYHCNGSGFRLPLPRILLFLRYVLVLHVALVEDTYDVNIGGGGMLPCTHQMVVGTRVFPHR